MHSTKIARLILVCLCALVLVGSGAQAQRKKQIAVLNFDFTTVDIGLAGNAYGGQENLAVNISNKLMNSLVAQGSCVVIERSQLEKVLQEQNLGTMGRIDPSTAARIGQILGVDALILGSVSVFDLQGLPQNSQDYGWTSANLRARIAVNYRIVNTTTAVVEASNESSGKSSGSGPASNPQLAAKQTSDLLSGLGKLGGNSGFGRVLGKLGNSSRPEMKSPTVNKEEIRNVVQAAVDDVVNNITVGIGAYLSGVNRQPEAPAAEKQLNGHVIDVQGPTVFISGLDRSKVHIGDRLAVRRIRVKKDPASGKEIRLSDKIGEVEITEIQDEAIVGSFSGSMKPQDGDQVTNNPGALGAPTLQSPPQASPKDAPSTVKSPTSTGKTSPTSLQAPRVRPRSNP